MAVTKETLDAMVVEVRKRYPNVQLHWRKRDTYVEMMHESVQIHVDGSAIAWIRAAHAEVDVIEEVVRVHQYAYQLATERTKTAFIDKLCDTFNLDTREED